MTIRLLPWVTALTLFFVSLSAAGANAPVGNNTFDYKTPRFGEPSVGAKLEIHRDANESVGKLILPAKLFAGMKSSAGPTAQAAGIPLLGIAFTGTLIAGGLLLMRVPRAKLLLGLMIPLLGAAFLSSGIHAQPAGLGRPREVVETGKVRILRSATATNIQLFLPKKPLPAAAK